ncbi:MULTISPECIES: NHLP leader peptide family RiPP precursor [Leptolyngbya]|uniref:NHLP leader peptide family RiPP precursor n=1 Tax=Leptolyngbya TaxID=47251 RepID=UPI001F553A74|nr:NHLP leader peptide family RiPP precursor [Leptolyngbya sp. FACHB-1624]
MTTSDSTPSARMTEIEAQLIHKAMQDMAFRDRLLANPKAVLAEQGLVVPDDIQIQVLQETSNQYFLVLPTLSLSEEETVDLSDSELETVSGGVDTTNTSWTGCASGRSGCIVSTNCQARDYPGTW